MNRKSCGLPPLFFGALVSGTASDAFGCSICVSAVADYYLPPIGLWALVATGWFVAMGIVRDITNRPLPWQPRFPSALAIAAGFFILAGAVIGLGSFLLLLIPPVIGLIGAWSRRSVPDERGLVATKIVGGIFVAGMVCLTVLLIQIHLTRTPAQYISKWGMNGPAFAQFKKLRENEPASLEAYQYLVKNANSFMAKKAAERIEAIEREADARKPVTPSPPQPALSPSSRATLP